MIDLNELCKVTLANAEKRKANGGNITTETRKMLKHCATEVVEAMEAYAGRIYPDWEYADYDLANNEYAMEIYNEDRERFTSELADIICCVLIIAGKEEIDIEKAINGCIEKNRKRAEGVGDKL